MKEIMTIRPKRDVRIGLTSYAKQIGITRNALINSILYEWLQKYGGNKNV